MIRGIFDFYYATESYPGRLKPLSKTELCKGMSEEAASKYLSLVEQLYNASVYDVNAKFDPPSFEEHLKAQHEKAAKGSLIYENLIAHLFKQDAISGDTYCELNKYMPVTFDFLECPHAPGKYIGDSLDDFRLSLERGIAEANDNNDMDQEYLVARYGYASCVRPEAETKTFVTNADCFLFRYEEVHQLPFREISYWEARHLLKQIQQDMKLNADEQALLDASFCNRKKLQFDYYASLQKPRHKDPRNLAEWYTIKRALKTEAHNLWRVEDSVKGIFEAMKPPTDTVGSGATLYIYEGRIVCHQQKHPIAPATALLHNAFDQEIELDVEYCPTCNRYMLNLVSFERYREKHDILIGKLQMISSDGAGGEVIMASKGPLMLSGYNTDEAKGLSSATRRFILAKIIHDGAMLKTDVVHYLENFIRVNGAKKENALALQKWREDLDFVHKYNMDTQPQVYISEVKKY